MEHNYEFKDKKKKITRSSFKKLYLLVELLQGIIKETKRDALFII